MKKTENQRDEVRRRNAGFTLVEIMIVVTIIGLLATLVTFSAPEMIHRNRVKVCMRNIEMLQNAVDIYYSEMGSFPKELTELVNAKDQDGIALKIIKKLPKDPWNNDFVYEVPGKGGEEYSISSYGADKAQGGDGKNADITSWEMGQPSGE